MDEWINWWINESTNWRMLEVLKSWRAKDRWISESLSEWIEEYLSPLGLVVLESRESMKLMNWEIDESICGKTRHRSCGVKFRVSELRVLPAVDLTDPTAGAKLVIGACGGVLRWSNHAEVKHHHRNAQVQVQVQVLPLDWASWFNLVMGNMEIFNIRLGRQLRQHQHKLEIKLRKSTREVDQDASCKCKVYKRNKLMFQCEFFASTLAKSEPCNRRVNIWYQNGWWMHHLHGWRSQSKRRFGVWPKRQETGSSVMCEPVAEREYEGNIRQLI